VTVQRTFTDDADFWAAIAKGPSLGPGLAAMPRDQFAAPAGPGEVAPSGGRRGPHHPHRAGARHPRARSRLTVLLPISAC
jgi:hypothetical protein